MQQPQLTLRGGETAVPLTSPLARQEPSLSPEAMLQGQSAVYSSQSYRLELDFSCEPQVLDVMGVSVNDEPLPQLRLERRTEPNQWVCSFGLQGGQIFAHCFGLVRLSVRMQTLTGQSSLWHSNYFSVIVPATAGARSKRRMARFVYDRLPEFAAGFARRQIQDSGLRTQVALLEQIVAVYEQNAPYFRRAPCTRLVTEGRIDAYEKLSGVTEQTLRHILQHPDELHASARPTGIHFNGIDYLPRRTMVFDGHRTVDVPENRAVVGFLLGLRQAAETLLEHARSSPALQVPQGIVAEGALLSSLVFIEDMRQNLDSDRRALGQIRERLVRVLNWFEQLWPVPVSMPPRLPPRRGAFAQRRPYQQVYAQMARWYCLRPVQHDSEQFLLLFKDSSKLYEYYVLTRILTDLTQQGFVLHSAEQFDYRDTSRFHREEAFNNTFVFVQGARRVTVYFQPIVRGTEFAGANELRLYRTTSVSLHRDWGDTYTPDYIIKMGDSDGGPDRYLVADAKMCDGKTVFSEQIADLTFKYIQSVDHYRPEDRCLGLVVFCEKPDLSYGPRRVDLSAPRRSLFDCTELLGCPRHGPMTEVMLVNEEVSHMSILDFFDE